MKIYSNTITSDTVAAILVSAKLSGLIADHVWLDRNRDFTPRQAWEHGVDVVLQAAELDSRGRRRNTGYAGASYDSYAATYDEWGFLIHRLYERDPDAKIGPYGDVDDFDYRTGSTYNPAAFQADFDFLGGNDAFPFVMGSVSNGRSGRVGAGRRTTELAMSWSERQAVEAFQWYEQGNRTQRSGLYMRYAPRTLADVLAFNHVAPAVSNG